MNDQANDLDRADQEALTVYEVSDEALEAAGGPNYCSVMSPGLECYTSC